MNGAAGAAPAYTFLDGARDRATLEYQLCFKCHSGSTVLPSNAGFTPSLYALDKAIEFNPANASYHPIEAAGTNQTPQMAASLAGSSPFKQWNFSTTSTIRCLDCHASSDRFDPSAPQAGVDQVEAGAEPAAAHQPEPRDPAPELPRSRAQGTDRGVRRERLRAVLRVPRRGALRRHVR